MLLLYIGASYLYNCYRKHVVDYNVIDKIASMRGAMSALMQGALPESYKALSDLNPYASSDYIDEYGSWSIAPLSRSIYEALDDDEVAGELSHAIAMHQAFPDIIQAILSVKEVFIMESIAAVSDVDLLYIHYRLRAYMWHIDCTSLEYIIAADGDYERKLLNLPYRIWGRGILYAA